MNNTRIWKVEYPENLLHFVVAAGPIDHAIVDSAQTPQRPTHRPNAPRWYYLVEDAPQVTVIAVTAPLNLWRGPAKLLITERPIIGEFAGNKPFVGYQGLVLKLEPWAWMRGQADATFRRGSDVLHVLSSAIVELKEKRIL